MLCEIFALLVEWRFRVHAVGTSRKFTFFFFAFQNSRFVSVVLRQKGESIPKIISDCQQKERNEQSSFFILLYSCITNQLTANTLYEIDKCTKKINQRCSMKKRARSCIEKVDFCELSVMQPNIQLLGSWSFLYKNGTRWQINESSLTKGRESVRVQLEKVKSEIKTPNINLSFVG